MEKEILSYAQKCPAGSRVLDAGAGGCVYKKLFSHCNYESADFMQMDSLKYGEITYVCNLENIPVEDNKYDFILCTQVLEHLAEPELVLRELIRILKPGGRIFCTVPFYYHEHGAPYDFWRFTQFGLSHLFSKAGFQIERLYRLEGVYQASAKQLSYLSENLPATQRIARKIFQYYADKFRALEMKNKIIDIGMPINYVSIAIKPEEGDFHDVNHTYTGDL